MIENDPRGLPSNLGPVSAAADSTSPTDYVNDFNKFMAQAPAPLPKSGSGSGAGQDLAETFRHGGWKHTRKIINDTLLEMRYSVNKRRQPAFACCGADATVEKRFLGTKGACEFRIRSTKCHDRFCIPCSNERAQRYRTCLLQWMYQRPNLSLITLTIKQSDATLTECLDRITKHFRTLRTRPIWKNAVDGGVAIIESKIADDGKSWNCHFHIICQAKFIRIGDLSAAWLQITKDSHVVDVRRVGALNGAVQYVTKYVTKAADHNIIRSPKHLREALVAFTGRRLVSTFGTWRGLILSENPDAEQEPSATASSWSPCGRLHDVLARALIGDAESLAIVRAIAPHKFRTRSRPPPPPD